MNIEISGQGMAVTDALQKFVAKRLEGIERRSRHDEDRIEVVLGTEGDRNHVSMHAVIGNTMHDVKSESHDMYVAIDKANHRLRRVIEDGHDKAVESKRRQ